MDDYMCFWNVANDEDATDDGDAHDTLEVGVVADTNAKKERRLGFPKT